MATAKTTTLTFRIEPSLKEALCAAANREHRSIVSMVEVLIRDWCGRNGIAIPEQGTIFDAEVPSGDLSEQSMMATEKTAGRKETAAPRVGRLPREKRAPDGVQGVSPERNSSAGLVKTKQRVADHGEVFTPAWMVTAMLDLAKDETERIDSRFLEPACGSGNFLVKILQRKLVAVELKFGKSDFEKQHYALLALMCSYGIELLPDNIAECRANMLEIFTDYLKIKESDDLYRAAYYVLSQNLVHGDALTMRAHDGQPITFAEWGYLGKGKFQRRDFRFDVLTGSSAFSTEGSLFAHLGKHEIFTPAKTYPPMTVSELAAGVAREAPALAPEGKA